MTLWDPQPCEPKKVEVQIPPHNGFGNEDDALGYVYKLVPKPAKKDMFK